MTAEVLSVPFRISKNGEASKVEQGSDNYYSEQLASIVLTGQGERQLEPFFGMPDVAFDGFNHSALHTQTDLYLPELSNIDAKIETIGDDRQSIVISFETGRI